MRVTALAAACVVLWGPSAALADEIVQEATANFISDGELSSTLYYEQFDPTLGTLFEVKYYYSVTVYPAFYVLVENPTATGPVSIEATPNVATYFDGDGVGHSLPTEALIFPPTGGVNAPAPENFDLSGTIDPSLGFIAASHAAAQILVPDLIDSPTGSTNTSSPYAFVDAFGGQIGDVDDDTRGFGSVQLTYLYTPPQGVPEPSSGVLLASASGCLVGGLALRRRRNTHTCR